jgi:cell division protein FtsQ
MTTTTSDGTTSDGTTSDGTTSDGTTTNGTTTGTPEATTGEAGAPVRIDPRIRERRIEVTRAAGRRRLRVLLVASIALSAAGLMFLAVTSPVLDVDRIVVTGASHVTNAQIRAASGVHTHDHLLFVDTGAAARRIEQLPWVETATVHRDLPGTLEVTVKEYIPTAYVRVPGGAMLLAANGHAIARVAQVPAHAVEVRGVRRAPDAGELLAPPDAAGVVRQLPAALAQRVAAVDVSGDGIALDTIGNASKSASALAVLGSLGGAQFTYVDVSVPSRPLVARTAPTTVPVNAP